MCDFELWFEEICRIARLMGMSDDALLTITRENFRPYFDDGVTAGQAWECELSAAI